MAAASVSSLVSIGAGRLRSLGNVVAWSAGRIGGENKCAGGTLSLRLSELLRSSLAISRKFRCTCYTCAASEGAMPAAGAWFCWSAAA